MTRNYMEGAASEPLIQIGDPVKASDLPPGEFDRLVDEGHIVPSAKR